MPCTYELFSLQEPWTQKAMMRSQSLQVDGPGASAWRSMMRAIVFVKLLGLPSDMQQARTVIASDQDSCQRLSATSTYQLVPNSNTRHE